MGKMKEIWEELAEIYGEYHAKTLDDYQRLKIEEDEFKRKLTQAMEAEQEEYEIEKEIKVF